MLRLLLTLTCVFLTPLLSYCADVSQYLQDVSVTIKSGGASGSGVITNIKGVNYVWTAGHVVSHLRKTREVVDPMSGSKKLVVEFDPVQVVKDLVEGGRKVGHTEFSAEVLKYSEADNGGQDLALLRVHKKNLSPHTVKFYLDKEIPKLGTELYHVGSLLGHGGSHSMTSGIYSQIGRLHENQVFDQTSCTAFPGSSGGGVFLKSDGRYVGMVVRGAGETFNLVVPVRRMSDWATKMGVLWTLNPELPVPTEDEFRKLPIEDVGQVFKK